jgi:hypothetical protein
LKTEQKKTKQKKKNTKQKKKKKKEKKKKKKKKKKKRKRKKKRSGRPSEYTTCVTGSEQKICCSGVSQAFPALFW